MARANAALEARRPGEAAELFDVAEKQGARTDLCAAGRWKCAMLNGDFEYAWRQSDLIGSLGIMDPDRLWDGRTLDKQRVIVRCLHGYGDTIQFIRYANALRSRAAYLIVEAEAKIAPLLQRLTAIDEVVTWGEAAPATPPEWDVQVEVTELPRIFRTTLSTIPSELPYIVPDPSPAARSCLVVNDARALKVGLAWKCGEWNPARSMKLATLAPILTTPEVAFYSLQWQGASELSAISSCMLTNAIIDLAVGSFTLDEATSAISQLDLIITVDTVTAHLAGAGAKAVWTMLPFEADWRWMLDRSDSPWYPTMRLFRQPSPGDWDSVVACVGAALAECAGHRPANTRVGGFVSAGSRVRTAAGIAP